MTRLNKSYFRHDTNARNDNKIVKLRAKHGNDGYAIYFMILEYMAENENCRAQADDEGSLAICLSQNVETLKRIVSDCINIGLFKLSENTKQMYSPRMEEHLKIRLQSAQAGRQGGLKRTFKQGKEKEKERKKEGNENSFLNSQKPQQQKSKFLTVPELKAKGML